MKIGVYICQCGINIAQTVDVEKVAEYANTLPSVEVARFYKYMCSDPGQELIKKDIKEMKLDRVVVASCSPRMHEPTFRAVLEDMGMNPYYFEMVNLREHCSWVHEDTDKATAKAFDFWSCRKSNFFRTIGEKRSKCYSKGNGYRWRNRWNSSCTRDSRKRI
jgi:heterodisulfide reductase subunit A